MTHERVSASRVARQNACPGSANLPNTIPGWVPPVVDETAGQAGRGTRVHDALHLLSELTPGELGKFIKALQYYEALINTRRFKVLSEDSQETEWLTTKPRTTVDRVLYTQDELHIIDWKWGKILVEVIENEQLMFYALNYVHLAPQATSVTLHIVQPLADNIVSWEVSAQRLHAFQKQVQETEAKILAQDTSTQISDNCIWCPAYPHARVPKGSPMCPTALNFLYPFKSDDDAILQLVEEVD